METTKPLMAEGDLVFVYGTLRPGNGNSLTHFQGGARLIGPDNINGLLYNIGWFPGAINVNDNAPFNPDQSIIVGEVFQIPSEFLGRRLDQYEGFPNLYDRVRVMTERGLYAWVYTYNSDVSDAWLIPDGDWNLRPVIQAV